MDSTKQSTSTSSQRSGRGFLMLPANSCLEQEYEEWKNDPQAQSEYQQWLRKEQQRRSQLPDPLESLESKFNQIFGESK